MCSDLTDSGSRENAPQEACSESYFDQAAQRWDDNPVRRELALAVAQGMADAIAFGPEMKIMDFGCGTGLIARELAPKVARVTAVDTSAEMVSVLKEKAQAAGLTGIEPLLLNEECEPTLAADYDAIVSSMVLHHVEDLSGLTERFAQWCRPGAWIALADLEPEGGTFHRPGQQVAHDGIDPAVLSRHLEKAGFATQSVRTVHTIQRPPAEGGEPRDYPVFLLVAQRTLP